jgi:hypothetical protein
MRHVSTLLRFEFACQEAEIRRALEAASIEFIDENGGGPGFRLRKSPRLKKPK